MPQRPPGRLRIGIVAGEASGDQLGASLLMALRGEGTEVDLIGVGGEQMEAAGLASLFPQSDIAVMGFGPVIRRLPLILRRIRETADAIVAAKPDILITIDSPDFCKRVARKVRLKAPEIPIVHWVCPSVWAWRPGRAPAMRPYIDRILCLLPFEPQELAALRGPEGVYVGHPLIEKLAALRPQNEAEEAARADVSAPSILMLPGSRMAEIRRLLPEFLAVARQWATEGRKAHWLLPTLPHVESAVRTMVAEAGIPVAITTGEPAKHAAFRTARAALAASGTVTLELALAGIPTIAAYRVAGWEAAIARRMVRVPSVILPNLVLHESVVPEFLQEACTTPALASALAGIAMEGEARARQTEGFARLEEAMRSAGAAPSVAAARSVLDLAEKARKRMAHGDFAERQA